MRLFGYLIFALLVIAGYEYVAFGPGQAKAPITCANMDGNAIARVGGPVMPAIPKSYAVMAMTYLGDAFYAADGDDISTIIMKGDGPGATLTTKTINAENDDDLGALPECDRVYDSWIPDLLTQ
jgi:hypothetical protein